MCLLHLYFRNACKRFNMRYLSNIFYNESPSPKPSRQDFINHISPALRFSSHNKVCHHLNRESNQKVFLVCRMIVIFTKSVRRFTECITSSNDWFAFLLHGELLTMRKSHDFFCSWIIFQVHNILLPLSTQVFLTISHNSSQPNHR
jgi:hypothetical protein